MNIATATALCSTRVGKPKRLASLWSRSRCQPAALRPSKPGHKGKQPARAQRYWDAWGFAGIGLVKCSVFMEVDRPGWAVLVSRVAASAQE